MHIHVQQFDDDHLITETNYQPKRAKFSIGPNTIAVGETEVAGLGRVGNRHYLDIYAFAERVGPDLDSCWIRIS